MKATVVDLRYRMKDVLRALDRQEDVSVLYHGRLRGTIIAGRKRTDLPVRAHAFFGMRAADTTVADEMDRLRGGRHRAL